MKIALIGYGKMGKMIEQIARERGHEIVSIIDIDNQQDFYSPQFQSADVAIEFTAPQAAYGNYLKAFSHGVKVVSGSTGWMKDHGDDVRRMCCEEGQTLFWASNFSIGVAIFSAANRYLAKIMNIPAVQPSHLPTRSWSVSTARKHGQKRPPTPKCCVWIISVAARWQAYTPCATTRMPTLSPSPTMPIAAKASHLVPCLLPNTPKTIRDCSPYQTCLNSKSWRRKKRKNSI